MPIVAIDLATVWAGMGSPVNVLNRRSAITVAKEISSDFNRAKISADFEQIFSLNTIRIC